MENMKKISILFGILLVSTSVFAKPPVREGGWALNQQNAIEFIELDMFDQQFLTVSVASQLPNGKPASAISMFCHGEYFNIQPGQHAVCVVNWSYEIATLTIPQGDADAASAGTYKLTYIS